MNGNWDDYIAGDEIRKYKRGDPSRGKINSLLTELLEKEEELTVYKDRLKELETAFYYNLELITERDFELTILEKQLGSENEQLQELIRERNELEDLVKVINDKYNKKIKQLETRLSLKTEEIRDVQRENLAKVDTLKKLLDDVRHQQEKKLSKMSTKFEIQKKELLKSHQEEMEEKEKYYLLEIDNLAGQLAQVCIEKDELIKTGEENKTHLRDLEKLLGEKENQYREEVRKNSTARKITKEAQCNVKPQVSEKKTQAETDTKTADVQTEDDYLAKINFLREQNEVLKYIVKDLKRNRDVGAGLEPPGCECFQIGAKLDEINRKYQTEINNLRKILEEEGKHRTEEYAVIESLETSVTFLKNKLLSGLQDKLNGFEGGDVREIQTEIRVALLEEKLTRKIDSIVTAAEEERNKTCEQLQLLQKEWLDKMEKYLKPREIASDDLLPMIRMEIHKLEDKIESDVRNIAGNNSERNKCEKKYQRRVECPERSCSGFPEVRPGKTYYYCRNDLTPEKYISIFSPRISPRRTTGEGKGFRKVTNNLVLGK